MESQSNGHRVSRGMGRSENTGSTANGIAKASHTFLSVNPISEATKSVTDAAADIVSSLGRLFDISLSPSPDETAEEAEK